MTAAAEPHVIVCRGCGGWQLRGQGDGRPWGWYSVSVSVPAEIGKRGAPYVWAGTWCSARCLADSAPDLARAEELALTAYDADPPRQDARPPRA